MSVIKQNIVTVGGSGQTKKSGQAKTVKTSPPAVKEKTIQPTESVQLTEVRTPGSDPVVKPLRKPRPGSFMEGMVDTLKEQGQLTHTPVQDKKVSEPPKPRSDDMAQMVKDIAEPNSHLTPAVGPNGTIVMLDDSQYLQASNTWTSEQKPTEKKVEGGEHHAHPHKSHGQEQALVGKHLVTEIVEKMGHHAHHAVEHVADHGADVAQAVGEKIGHVAHGVTAHQKALAKGHEVGEAVTHGTTDVSHGAKELSEAGGHAAHLSEGLSTALKISAAASGVIAVPLMVMGGKQIVQGRKEMKEAKLQGDKEKRAEGMVEVAEGVGNTAVGLRSAGAAVVMADMAQQGLPLIGQIAPTVAKFLPGLGLVHAAVDVGVGVRDIRKGKTTDGLLKIGFGVAVGAAAVGGGIPATVAALSILGVKVTRGYIKKRQEKKAAKVAEKAAQTQQQQLKQVPAQDAPLKVQPTKGGQQQVSVEHKDHGRGSPPT